MCKLHGHYTAPVAGPLYLTACEYAGRNKIRRDRERAASIAFMVCIVHVPLSLCQSPISKHRHSLTTTASPAIASTQEGFKGCERLQGFSATKVAWHLLRPLRVSLSGGPVAALDSADISLATAAFAASSTGVWPAPGGDQLVPAETAAVDAEGAPPEPLAPPSTPHPAPLSTSTDLALGWHESRAPALPHSVSPRLRACTLPEAAGARPGCSGCAFTGARGGGCSVCAPGSCWCTAI